MSGDIQLRMFSDPIKDALATDFKLTKESLERHLAHSVALPICAMMTN